MDYLSWRNEVFGMPSGSDPMTIQLSEQNFLVPSLATFDYIDRSLVDSEIQAIFSIEQIGAGLLLIYSNSHSDLPYCYTEVGNEARRIKGIINLRYLYSNFFNRYCLFPVNNIEEVNTERAIDYLCYMFWDIFPLCSENATSSMIDVALEVMSSVLQYKNDYCIVSAIHGLGHWVLDVPQSSNILQNWLKTPTTSHEEIQDYARQAMTGYIL